MDTSHFLYFFWWRKPYVFLDTLSPACSSRERLAVSVAPERSWRGALLQDSSVAPRAAVGTRLAAGELVVLLGPRDRGNQGPGCSCWSLVPGLALSPLSLILDSRTFGTQWNHHFKAKRN